MQAGWRLAAEAMTAPLSPEVEAAIAKVVWVSGISGAWHAVHIAHLEGQPQPAKEAHAECEALREQIREVVRAALDERDVEIVAMMRDEFGHQMPLATLRGVLRSVRARWRRT